MHFPNVTVYLRPLQIAPFWDLSRQVSLRLASIVDRALHASKKILLIDCFKLNLVILPAK